MAPRTPGGSVSFSAWLISKWGGPQMNPVYPPAPPGKTHQEGECRSLAAAIRNAATRPRRGCLTKPYCYQPAGRANRRPRGSRMALAKMAETTKWFQPHWITGSRQNSYGALRRWAFGPGAQCQILSNSSAPLHLPTTLRSAFLPLSTRRWTLTAKTCRLGRSPASAFPSAC